MQVIIHPFSKGPVSFHFCLPSQGVHSGVVEKGGKNRNGGVVFPENVSVHLSLAQFIHHKRGSHIEKLIAVIVDPDQTEKHFLASSMVGWSGGAMVLGKLQCRGILQFG